MDLSDDAHATRRLSCFAGLAPGAGTSGACAICRLCLRGRTLVVVVVSGKGAQGTRETAFGGMECDEKSAIPGRSYISS